MTFQSCMAPKSMMSFEEFLRKEYWKMQIPHVCLYGNFSWLLLLVVWASPGHIISRFWNNGPLQLAAMLTVLLVHTVWVDRVYSLLLLFWQVLDVKPSYFLRNGDGFPMFRYPYRINQNHNYCLMRFVYIFVFKVYILYMFIPFVVPLSHCLDNKMCWKKCSGDTLVRTPGVWIWTVVMVMQIRETMKALNNQKKTAVERLCGWVSVDDLLSGFFCQGFLWVFFVFMNL